MSYDNDMERRIRERAYQIWQEEGCPAGQADQHWLKAQWLVALEDAPSVTPVPDMPSEPAPEEEALAPHEADPTTASRIESALSLFRYQRKY